MGKIEVGVDIDAPLEKVFELFTDFSKASERIDGISKLELLTSGPIGKGTRFRETRVMMGKEATEEMEITDFQPNESYRVEAESCGAHYQTDYTFRPNGDRTKVEMSFEGKPVTFAAKLLSPAFLVMAKTVRKCLQDDLDCLKRIAESDDA
ncbi:MAG: SRPBCC family protein [Planctomycetales bacterium]|nr:SRPBCC family protein [Planctomycetales bacterium]